MNLEERGPAVRLKSQVFLLMRTTYERPELVVGGRRQFYQTPQ
jgi:hypothetical protein